MFKLSLLNDNTRGIICYFNVIKKKKTILYGPSLKINRRNIIIVYRAY